MKKRIFCALLGCVVSAAVHGADVAPAFPSKPITIVVPYPAGASADALMRLVAQKMSEQTGYQTVIDNKPGANGVLGAAMVKRAPADGYTLFQAFTGSHAINSALYANLPYDPVKDFAPISVLWTFPSLLVVPAGSAARSVKDLVEMSRKNPQGLTYASPGIGSGTHLTGELFKKAGAVITHVPYKGAAPAVTDLVAGRVDMMFVSYASIGAYVQEGKLRILAVASNARLRAFPEIPTIAEAGYPGVELDNWFGLAAPAGTPPAIVQKLHDIFERAARDPQLVSQLAAQGIEIMTNTPQAFGTLIASDLARLGALARAAGVE